MRALIRRYYRDLTRGLLFRPLLLTLLHGALALAVVLIDQRLPGDFFEGSVETARAVLTTIAGASFTAISITFTITIVTLQLVSGQFTPRALRGFLGRPWVQLVAGQFMGLVLYCLVSLGLMPDAGQDVHYGLPGTTAVVLSVLALLSLIVFIDRIARAIQVSNIVADLAATTRAALERHYRVVEDPADGVRPALDEAWPTIAAERDGVVQSIDLDALCALAEKTGAGLRLAVQPGDFVIAGEPLARVERGARADLEAVDGVAALRGAVALKSQRDLKMDPAFGVRQLADIAVRALSPGINDPSTADHVLHWLSALFCPLLAEPRPTYRRRAAGEGVVEMPLRTIEHLLREAFEEVVVYGADNPRIARGLARTVERLARVCHPDHRPAIERLRAAQQAMCDRLPDGLLERGQPNGEGGLPCDVPSSASPSSA